MPKFAMEKRDLVHIQQILNGVISMYNIEMIVGLNNESFLVGKSYKVASGFDNSSGLAYGSFILETDSGQVDLDAMDVKYVMPK